MTNSFCSFNFCSLSSFLVASFNGWIPPDLTCFSTCWMNFCCFAPFLFFRPKVLSYKKTATMITSFPQYRNEASLCIYQCLLLNRGLLVLQKPTSITFSFFFCSVFLLGAAGAAFLGGMFKHSSSAKLEWRNMWRVFF